MFGRIRSTAEYLVLRQGARVGTSRWTGNVIVGTEAIYIFQKSRDVNSVGVLVGGALGAVVDTAVDRLLPTKDLQGGTYDEIPASVRNHPGWPVRRVPACRVLIVPREQVRVLRHTFGSHEVETEFMGVGLAVQFWDFAGPRVKRFLIDEGWPLVWTGKQFNITDPTVLIGKAKRPIVALSAVVVGLACALVSMSYVILPVAYQRRLDTGFLVLFGVSFISILVGIVAIRRNQ